MTIAVALLRRGGGYSQYLNCSGDASLHRDLDVHPSKFECWVMKQSRASQDKYISYKIRSNIIPNYGEDLFFLFLLDFREKTLQLSAKTFFCFFWSSPGFGEKTPQLRGQNYIISTKASSQAKFYNLSTGYSPPPIGLSTKTQIKKNTTFLALLRLFFFALEWTKK